MRPLVGDHMGASSFTWSLGSPASGSVLTVHVPCMQLTPGTRPLWAISFQWLYSLCYAWTRHPLCTHGHSWYRLLPFTHNWCVIWDPPFVAHLYRLDFQCPISPHCLVACRYILMTDVWSLKSAVWPLLAPWRMCFDSTGPRCSWDPLRWHQHYQWSVNAQGLVGTIILFKFDIIFYKFKKLLVFKIIFIINKKIKLVFRRVSTLIIIIINYFKF